MPVPFCLSVMHHHARGLHQQRDIQGALLWPPSHCCRDFNTFVRVCEKYGRENVAQIATEIEGKTEEEVCA